MSDISCKTQKKEWDRKNIWRNYGQFLSNFMTTVNTRSKKFSEPKVQETGRKLHQSTAWWYGWKPVKRGLTSSKRNRCYPRRAEAEVTLAFSLEECAWEGRGALCLKPWVAMNPRIPGLPDSTCLWKACDSWYHAQWGKPHALPSTDLQIPCDPTQRAFLQTSTSTF